MDLTHLTHALAAIDPIAFDTSFVTRKAALMYLSDPVNWFQARPEVAREIRRVLGAPQDSTHDLAPNAPEPVNPTAAAVAPAAPQLLLAQVDEPVGDDLIGLLILAEEMGWPPESVSEAWGLYRIEPEMTGLSARPVTTMTYDAWVALLRRRGWAV